MATSGNGGNGGNGGTPSTGNGGNGGGTPSTGNGSTGSTGGSTGGTKNNGIGTNVASAEGSVPGVAATDTSSCGDSTICTTATTPTAQAAGASTDDTLSNTGAPVHAIRDAGLALGLIAGGVLLVRPRRRAGAHRLHRA